MRFLSLPNQRPVLNLENGLVELPHQLELHSGSSGLLLMIRPITEILHASGSKCPHPPLWPFLIKRFGKPLTFDEFLHLVKRWDDERMDKDSKLLVCISDAAASVFNPWPRLFDIYWGISTSFSRLKSEGRPSPICPMLSVQNHQF